MRTKYPEDLVARVRGAAHAGIPHKVIAKAAQIPLGTVAAIAAGDRRVSIPPDDSLLYVLRKWLQCSDFEGHAQG